VRVVVVGMGVQGAKRAAVAGSDVVATIDPVRDGVAYKQLADVPAGSFDAALLCVPDAVKLPLMRSLIEQGKHFLVEKPVLADADDALRDLVR